MLIICGQPLINIQVMAIVYKTKQRKRARAHGFLARKNSPTGKKILVRRRRRGRSKIVKV